MDIRWKEDKERMNCNKVGDVVFLSYPALEETQIVRHGFSTRLGGMSKGIYASMNLSFARGDEVAAVQENFHRIADAIGFAYDSIVMSDQTHTTNVRVVTESDRGCGITKPGTYTDVDGMVTNVPQLTLATFYADCVPLYFVDPVKKAIGLSHSGWRGTVGKMGLVTVHRMMQEYECDPRDILAAIGPSICQDCYEVSEDVIWQFREAFREEQQDVLYYKKENGKYQLDLWKANELVLMEAGILQEHIHLPGICTCCNPQLLFSHRASHGKRGNLAAFLQLK